MKQIPLSTTNVTLRRRSSTGSVPDVQVLSRKSRALLCMRIIGNPLERTPLPTFLGEDRPLLSKIRNRASGRRRLIQIHRVPKDATATAADLLAVPEGTITTITGDSIPHCPDDLVI